MKIKRSKPKAFNFDKALEALDLEERLACTNDPEAESKPEVTFAQLRSILEAANQ